MSKSKGHGGRLPTKSVKARAEALLRRTDLPYDQIVDKIRDVFPGAKTSTKSIAWYASRMKANGEKLPERPRVATAA